MKRLALLAFVIIVIVGGIYFFKSKLPSKALPQVEQKGIISFNTYIDQQTGFSIQYPSQYAVTSDPIPRSEWGSRTLLTIDNNPASTSTMPKAIPMTVTLIRQPVSFANGKIFRTITEYQKSGVAAKMVQGATNSSGELVTVNGNQALLFHFPESDYTGVTSDGYFFIHDDFIYSVGVDTKNPYASSILKSITWK